jgi:hypothetical protein
MVPRLMDGRLLSIMLHPRHGQWQQLNAELEATAHSFPHNKSQPSSGWLSKYIWSRQADRTADLLITN